ncbi:MULTISPECIES: glycosyltransferase [Streptomyces]|uniref:D-inositol 3-phosphate glycosyltransferase n=1 Tax=Streptomyces venezuelae (strain ATCC 10712 / CBS 650.69 / DSM 40230 / JCM 4526 / NBRC 13096 / PD 04745) TaxID=953739 RepID=F2RM07_STRVP|nr:glycosyltransferase [Streptomyces venezuelae]CCA60537.1 probable glycosyltransferase [Streptomyces venezuelae ATCC 10712]
MNSLRIALIASMRFPIADPFAGGLEAHTWALARALTRRGHRVHLFAAAGSDPALGARELPVRRVVLSAAARSDTSMPGTAWMEEHHAYLGLMLELARDGEDRFDVVHNNSLHYLPVAMASALRVPVITTLHTPPTPGLESAIQTDDECPVTFTAVSRFTASSWRPTVRAARVVRNGVDTDFWTPGPGGGDLVWSGRMVPEKAPRLAILAARAAGVPLLLAGPIADRRYFQETVEPLLGEGATYVGHLTRRQLAALLGTAAAVLVTPEWDEPYGLVVAEALACGTPVCGFDRGALAEILEPAHGLLAPPGDVQALATLIPRVMSLDHRDARRRAVGFCSLDRMADAYTSLYEEVTR